MIKIAIVGRQNVGKSTLFNRLIKKKRSIVSKIAGTTRDINSGIFEYNSCTYQVYDTGGFSFDKDNISVFTEEKILMAVSDADLVVFMLDGKEGLNPIDENINRILRKSGKKIIPVINKIDCKNAEENISDFYSLGYKEFITISAEGGNNITDLLDKIETEPGIEEIEKKDQKILRFSIIGEANVGKSTLFNNLTETDLRIVDSVAGTTRDYFEYPIKIEDKEFIIVDTAGLHKKNPDFLKKISKIMTEKALFNSDFCIFMIDATNQPTKFSYDILRLINKYGKSLMVIINKWDLVQDKRAKKIEIEQFLLSHINILKRAEIIYMSSIYMEYINKLKKRILIFADRLNTEYDEEKLNEILSKAYIKRKPEIKSHSPLIKGLKLIKTNPLIIKLKTNRKCPLPVSYLRYLENFFREYLNLIGIEIKIIY